MAAILKWGGGGGGGGGGAYPNFNVNIADILFCRC